jgi:hypothetical protein
LVKSTNELQGPWWLYLYVVDGAVVRGLRPRPEMENEGFMQAYIDGLREGALAIANVRAPSAEERTFWVVHCLKLVELRALLGLLCAATSEADVVSALDTFEAAIRARTD